MVSISFLVAQTPMFKNRSTNLVGHCKHSMIEPDSECIPYTMDCERAMRESG